MYYIPFHGRAFAQLFPLTFMVNVYTSFRTQLECHLFQEAFLIPC